MFNVGEDDVKVGRWGGRIESKNEFDFDDRKQLTLSNAGKVKVMAAAGGKNDTNQLKVQNVKKVKVTPDFDGANVGTHGSWKPMSPKLPGLFFTVKPLKRKLEETKGKRCVQKIKKGKSESILREKPIAFDLNASTQLVGETWCFKFRRYSGDAQEDKKSGKI